MTHEKFLTNAQAAHRVVTDWRTFKDANGDLIELNQELIVEGYASTTITKGQILMRVVPPDAVTLMRYAPATAALPGFRIAGIALNGAVAGGKVQVCTKGVCLVLFGANTPFLNQAVTLDGVTAGQASTTATNDATIIVGATLGEILYATKDANNLVPMWFEKV